MFTVSHAFIQYLPSKWNPTDFSLSHTLHHLSIFFSFLLVKTASISTNLNSPTLPSSFCPFGCHTPDCNPLGFMYTALTGALATSTSTSKNVLLIQTQLHFLPRSRSNLSTWPTHSNVFLDGESKGHEQAPDEGRRWILSSHVIFGQEAKDRPAIRQEY